MRLFRKIIVLITGVPLVILGIILIPLPGPGILVSFLGLFVLALEFEWAAKHRDRLKGELKKITDKARDRANKQK
jgi:uncharacterized protein (TIGR02611 family)